MFRINHKLHCGAARWALVSAAVGFPSRNSAQRTRCARLLRKSFRFRVAALAACALSAANVARAQSPPSAPPLPEGRGKAEFARICAQCHGLDIATKLRMSEDAWSGVVDDMVSRGAQG